MKGKLKNEIEKILGSVPETRNDDRRLFIEYVRRFRSDYIYGNGYILLDSIIGLPSYDTISRLRRQIQEGPNGKFKPTNEKIRQKRQSRQAEVKRDLGYPDHQTLHELIKETSILDKELKFKQQGLL
jgi:hypothetical protein